MFRYAKVILIGSFFVIAANTAWTGGAVIQLPERFIVENENAYHITLGDLAVEIRSDDAELKRRLQAVNIASAPSPGEQILSSRNIVLRAIRSEKIPFIGVQFEGPGTFTLLGPGQEISVNRMVRVIHEHLLRESGWEEDELVMRVISAPQQSSWLPPGEVKFHVRSPGRFLLGTGRYEVGFYIDRIQVDSAPFTVAVERKRPVFVPTRNIQRGDVIAPGDLEERIVVISRPVEDDQLVDELEAIVGGRCRVAMRRNEPIQWRMLETNYILRRGDVVNLLLEQNGLSMQTLARAQQRGAPGQVIPFKTISTGQLIKARIINRDYVEYVDS